MKELETTTSEAKTSSNLSDASHTANPRSARRRLRTRSVVRTGLSCSLLVATMIACSDSTTSSEPTDAGETDASRDATADVADAETRTDAATDTGVVDASTDTGFKSDGGVANLSALELDFGSVDCGTTASAQTLTISNPSAKTVSWSTALNKGTSSWYSLSATSGKLAPGDTTVITVTSKAIPSTSSTASNAYGDILLVTLDSSTKSVQLKQTAHGSILQFFPTGLDFGNVPTNNTSSATMGVANTGNSLAHVAMTLSGDASYSLISGSPFNVDVGGGGTGTSLVSFTPTAAGTFTGSVDATVGVTDVLCAPLPTAFTLTGKGTKAQAAITPASVLFGESGFVNCGTVAAAQSITIKNTGTGTLTWSSALLHGSTYFTLSATSGTILAGGTQTVTVTPKAIPASTAIVTDGFSDTLTITTNAPDDTPHDIALHQTARGAIVSRSANAFGFGNVPQGTTGTATIVYANTGNIDITLGFANGDPAVSQPLTLPVGAGGFATETGSFTPTLVKPYNDIGTVTNPNSTPLCGTLPGNISITGTGTTTSLTASPTSLAFGSVLCNGKGDPLTVKITNNGPQTGYTATLLKDAGSYFTVSPPTGTISATGSVTLTVDPLQLPKYGPTTSNYYGDTLRVTTSNGVIDVALSETALGAILAYSKATNAYGAVTVNTTAQTAFTVTNSGNLTTNVTLSASPTVYTVDPSVPTSITGNSSLPFNVFFKPAAVTSYNTGVLTMSVPGTTTLCQPLPADATLTGSGK